MIKKHIYIIRHGETDYNRQGIVQGSGVDAPLNALGQQQATEFFEAYQHVSFDKIYTSALCRTIQSVTKFIEKGIPHERHAELNEISWGIREGKTPTHDDNGYYKWLVRNWQEGNIALAAEGGESPIDVQERQKRAMAVILSRPHEQTILIAMHGRALRILLATLLQKEIAHMDTFEHQNLSLYVLEHDYAANTFQILRANDVQHLAGR